MSKNKNLIPPQNYFPVTHKNYVPFEKIELGKAYRIADTTGNWGLVALGEALNSSLFFVPRIITSDTIQGQIIYRTEHGLYKVYETFRFTFNYEGIGFFSLFSKRDKEDEKAILLVSKEYLKSYGKTSF